MRIMHGIESLWTWKYTHRNIWKYTYTKRNCMELLWTGLGRSNFQQLIHSKEIAHKIKTLTKIKFWTCWIQVTSLMYTVYHQSHITIIFPIWTWLCRLRLLEFMPVAAWGPSDSDRWPAIWSHGPFTVLGTCFPCFPLCLLMIYDGLSWIYRCWFSMVFSLHGCVGHYTNPARFSLW